MEKTPRRAINIPFKTGFISPVQHSRVCLVGKSFFFWGCFMFSVGRKLKRRERVLQSQNNIFCGQYPLMGQFPVRKEGDFNDLKKDFFPFNFLSPQLSYISTTHLISQHDPKGPWPDFSKNTMDQKDPFIFVWKLFVFLDNWARKCIPNQTTDN